LLNPLGACIGACHAAAATTSLMEPVSPLVPEPLGPRFPPFEPEPRPAPEPEARLEPEPRPEERMDPFSPRVPDEEEPRRRRCTVEEVDPRFGRSPCHSDFAMTFSGTRREFRVTEPGGIATVFDAKQGPILYEVKTGYGWVLNQNLGPEMEQRRNEVINRFQEQAGVQLFIATRCGYELDWYFNSRSVAEFFDPL